MNGHEQVVTILLRHGAKVSDKDEQGRTALHLAVEHRREAILKILL
jgi:ankyrin repeat protein